MTYLHGVVHGPGHQLQVVGARQEAHAEEVGLVSGVHHDRQPAGVRVLPEADLHSAGTDESRTK